MPSSKLAALAALSLVAGSSAAIAQAPATPSTVSRAAPSTEGSSEIRGTTGWILAAVALALIIWGVIELTKDDEPSSP